MSTLGFYFGDSITQEEANEIRARLNNIAASFGYKARRGPTKGEGNAAALLVAIAKGEVVLVRQSNQENTREDGPQQDQQISSSTSSNVFSHLQNNRQNIDLPSMDELERAVLDLLRYLRYPLHKLTTGRILGPILIGRSDEIEDIDLASALEYLIKKELSQYPGFKKYALLSKADIDLVDLFHTLEGSISASKEIKSLITTWAYYVQGLETRVLCDIFYVSPRTVQVIIARGRRLLTIKIANSVAAARAQAVS